MSSLCTNIVNAVRTTTETLINMELHALRTIAERITEIGQTCISCGTAPVETTASVETTAPIKPIVPLVIHEPPTSN